MSIDYHLRITEIFYSLQGESVTVGLPTIFIRLTGCPLRCNYCDTTYAFKGGEKLSYQTILQKIKDYPSRLVCITGGEPLAQANSLALMTLLADRSYQVSLETSGALDISKVDPRITIVMDLKTPSSGESNHNLLANIAFLKSLDQIKFVIANKNDYQWALDIIQTHQLASVCQLLFSPSFGVLNPSQLADWILQDGLAVRFQLQLHKILWGDTPGR